MNETLSTILTSTIPAAVTAWLGWWFGKRKTIAEASGSELDNVQKALEIYRGIIGDLHEKIKLLETQLDKIQDEFDEYKSKNKN